jgi:Holliday junction resolvase RusA-like endonuclease
MITARINIKPLSVNASLASVRGRQIKTAAARKYLADLQLLLPANSKPLEGELSLILTVGLSSKQADLDNVIKPFQDALQTKYKFNDHQIYSLIASKQIVKKGQEFIEFSLTDYKDSGYKKTD